MIEKLFTVTFCTFFSEKPAFEFEVEKYNDNVLFCLRKGKFTYGFDSLRPDEFTAEAGDIILCNQGKLFYRKALEPVSLCMIRFKSDSPFPDIRQPIAAYDHARFEYNLEMLKCTNYIVEPMAGNVTEHYCRDIIYQVIDSAIERSRPLNEAYMYINSHFCENISVDEMAKSENFSTVHFINLFKREYGKTPKKYITDLRLKKAVYFIKNTAFNISEIANMCGYEDSLYFSRCFKKQYSMSPKEFRQKFASHILANDI